jgi:SAM-dependent methyltransferase
MSEENPYIGAYPNLRGRRNVWRSIARYIRRDAPDVGTLIELGAGYCDFINQFPADKKIAFDLNPEMQAHVADGVDLRIEDATCLASVSNESVDLIFASNFLEHLEADEIASLLERCFEVLKPGGRLILIQPNYRLCRENYFDDPTHKTIFDDTNVAQWLSPHGLSVCKLVPGLLPFSMNGRLPKSGILTWLYLLSPWKPMAAQMYVVARKAGG